MTESVNHWSPDRTCMSLTNSPSLGIHMSISAIDLAGEPEMMIGSLPSCYLEDV